MAFYDASKCTYIYYSHLQHMHHENKGPMMTPAAQSFPFQEEKKERKLAHRCP